MTGTCPRIVTRYLNNVFTKSVRSSCRARSSSVPRAWKKHAGGPEASEDAARVARRRHAATAAHRRVGGEQGRPPRARALPGGGGRALAGADEREAPASARQSTWSRRDACVHNVVDALAHQRRETPRTIARARSRRLPLRLLACSRRRATGETVFDHLFALASPKFHSTPR